MALRARIGAAMRNRIAQNTIALYASQLLLGLVPLVTLPWIARALGAAEFGEVVYTQSFAWLLAMVGEYGFRLSGTRAVAGCARTRSGWPGHVAGIQGAKLMLAGVSTLIALLALAARAALPRGPRAAGAGLAARGR